jgi:hypothetical protein
LRRYLSDLGTPSRGLFTQECHRLPLCWTISDSLLAGGAKEDLLQRAGVATEICRSVCELAEGIAAGAATALVAEEALFGHDLAPLTQWVY